jgi:hypothetical protein
MAMENRLEARMDARFLEVNTRLIENNQMFARIMVMLEERGSPAAKVVATETPSPKASDSEEVPKSPKEQSCESSDQGE